MRRLSPLGLLFDLSFMKGVHDGYSCILAVQGEDGEPKEPVVKPPPLLPKEDPYAFTLKQVRVFDPHFNPDLPLPGSDLCGLLSNSLFLVPSCVQYP